MLDRTKQTRRPSHPGAVLRAHYMEPLGLSVTSLAVHLRISRKTLSKVVNGRGKVTPDMAHRLSRAFSTSPELWLNLQNGLDLWDAEHNSDEWQKINPLPGLSNSTN